MRRTATVIAAVLLSISPALAQTAAPDEGLEQRAQGWALVTGQGYLTRELRWFAELQPRFDFGEMRAQQILTRAALGWQLSRPLSFWLGYGFTPSYLPSYGGEHRPFAQLLAEQKLGALSLVNRSRFEQRLLENRAVPSLRARHMLRAVHPLAGDLSVAGYDELFLNLNRVPSGPDSGLDQNRLFIGLNYKLDATLFLEGGYMAQYVFRTGADRLSHNVVLWLGASFPQKDAESK